MSEEFGAVIEADRGVSEPAMIVDVEGFEGPLDLLLMLARQQKVDLSKISILATASTRRSASGFRSMTAFPSTSATSTPS